MALIQRLAAPGGRFAVSALLLFLVVGVGNVQLTLVVLPLAAAVFVSALGRALSNGPWLPRVALVNLGLGLGVTLGLYWLSGTGLPALAGVVVKKGFWTFGGDAIYYHVRGLQIAYSLSHGVLFPQLDPTYGASYLGMVGLLYWGLGAHPLVLPFLNCLLSAVSVTLVYLVVTRLAGAATARRAALLTAIVPSMFLWSGQVMKDAPALFLFLLCLAFVVELLEPPVGGWLRPLALLGGLFLAGFLLHSLRYYLAPAVLAVLVAAILGLPLSRARRPRLLDAVATIVLFLAIVLSRAAGPQFLLVVANPVGSAAATAYRLGVERERKGDLFESRDHYLAAIRAQPQFWPAYRRLGEVLICLDDFPGARPVLERYLQLYPMDYSAPAVRRVIARLAELQVTAAADATLRALAPGDLRSIGGFRACGGAMPMEPVVADAARRDLQPALAHQTELLWVLYSRDYGDRGEFMLASEHDESPEREGAGLAAVLIEAMAKPLVMFSPAFAATVRNGFIRTGGESLYTRAIAREDISLLQWLKWAPGAFVTTLGAPFPWDWRKGGRVDPLRLVMGVESLAVLLLLPFALLGAWRALRSRKPGGVCLVALFAFLTTMLGLVIVNVGTLVRLRLPAVVLLIMLASLGLARPKTAEF